MNKLLLWIAICVFLSACTNWPREGYFDNTALHLEERDQFNKHYTYLNLHFSVANLRGAGTCTPAFVKTVNNINSRVEKAIAVEDPEDIKYEMAILESDVTSLIVNLNRVSANTNCALPPRVFASNFLHPLSYQLDLLLYCGPQFEVGTAVLTDLYKVCLRQVSFLLLENPDVVVQYTKYKLFEDVSAPIKPDLGVRYNQDIVSHDTATIIDINNPATESDQISLVDTDYNEVMRKYLVFDQIPSVDVQQLSQFELNIEQEHTPVQVHEVAAIAGNMTKLPLSTVDYASNLDDVELFNLRTDTIISFISELTSNPQSSDVIYEELKQGSKPQIDPIISTLMWQSVSIKQVNHKVKHWRLLLSEDELFSDEALPKGLAL